MRTEAVDIVSGTLRAEIYLEDKTLAVSDRIFDGTAAFVAKKGVYLRDDSLKIAVNTGFKIAKDVIKTNFPNYTILNCDNSIACFDAVINGEADLAVANKYVSSYILQKPQYDSLQFLNTDAIKADNCFISLTKDKSTIKLINKIVKTISENEYNSIMMNYIIINQYVMTFTDYLYKYRLIYLSIFTLLFIIIIIFIKYLSEQKIKDLLYHDSLTSCYSKYGFNEELKVSLNKNLAGNQLFIIAFDIIGFENFNVTYGRDCGDNIIKNLFTQISKHTPPNLIIARTYADNGIMAIQARSTTNIIEIITGIGNKVPSGFENVHATVKFGVYYVADHREEISQMIERASAALNVAKTNLDLLYYIYDEKLHQKYLKEISLVNSMTKALQDNEFYIALQPQFDNEMRLVGSEALVRWLHDDGKINFPGDFIELFEKNGQIIKLDFYVFEMCCALQREILDSGLIPPTVSSNFSKINMYDQTFITNLLSIVNKYNLKPELLQIEFSESVMLFERNHVITILHLLRENGFKVAIDNFGSGYSSLNSLKDLEIDVLKLDKQFIKDSTNVKNQNILTSLLNITKDLDITTMFEGIETDEQLQFINKYGGNYIAQGFYLSKPLLREEYLGLVKNNQ